MTELEAELYALTHRGNPGDVAFYARECAGVGSVLELGAGYGRLLPALGGAARDVVGLDREPRLLARARRSSRAAAGRSAPGRSAGQRRAIRLVLGDMQRFALGRTFERILLPYNGLYCLLGRRALASCLRCVRAHLAPGGKLLFDVWAADAFQSSVRARPLRAQHRDEVGALVSLCHRGQTWDVFERSSLRTALQRLDVTYSYVSRERGTRVESRIEQRYATSSELRQSLEAAGLTLERLQGGFSGQRFGRHSELLVAIASL